MSEVPARRGLAVSPLGEGQDAQVEQVCAVTGLSLRGLATKEPFVLLRRAWHVDEPERQRGQRASKVS